jgi:hypothetical protein
MVPLSDSSSSTIDHRPQLSVPGIGTWIVESEHGRVTFSGAQNYVESIQSNLWKFLDGGARAKYVDSESRYVLVDAQDEIIRGDGTTGDLKTVANLRRIEDQGLRRSQFLPAPTPVFIFELGVVVFSAVGQLVWFHNDLHLDHHFLRLEAQKIVYFSERRGEWSYELATGELTSGNVV